MQHAGHHPIIQVLALAVVLTGIGELVGSRLPLLRKIALPGAVLGGLLGLGLGSAQLLEMKNVFSVLGEFPALFINVVFACLLLGKRVDGFSKVWKRAQPHVIMGHLIAWGQYVVGLALVLFILGPLIGLNELAGPTIAIGFQGGHGTAAGLAENFQSLEFPQGKTIAYSPWRSSVLFLAPWAARCLQTGCPANTRSIRPKPAPTIPPTRQNPKTSARSPAS
ncbi:sodium/glutamate symporter [Pontiellaceae bacterium B1224]|nr:sodium/glutamate symporter [Pontiellaceae bacterium B1224]